MKALQYNIKNDINTYVITCSDELLDMYMKLLFENGAYKITINNKIVLTNMKDYETLKEEFL